MISSNSFRVYIALGTPVRDLVSLFYSRYHRISQHHSFLKSIMGVFRTLLLSASVAGFAAANPSPRLSDPSQACALLKQTFPNATLLPEDEGYKGENEGTFYVHVKKYRPVCPDR
jgi:hypothetical protein